MRDPFGCEEPSLLALTGSTDRSAARRAVASRATGAQDLCDLLDMLGLWPAGDPPPRSGPAPGTGRSAPP
ncbi:hypothetical protein [Streptomyces sp. NPDC001546]|uniref:hypothetical protein n=1 Tax=Streptomyces sp. NPDC001546 TaxID=3364585 RepID=UPI0036A12FA4